MENVAINPAIDYQVQHTFGVTPGSSRYATIDRNYAPLTNLQSGAINQVFVVGSGDTLDGKACFIEFICTARNEDDSPIVLADQLALEHGAGALLVSDITVTVGTQPPTHVARNDLTRYTVDVFAGEQKRVAMGGTYYYHDREAGVLSTSNLSFAAAQRPILDGQEFKLVHWLDHLPQFGPTDPHIPGPATITLNMQFSPTFSRLFKALTTSPKVATTPKLYINSARLNYRTAKIDPLAVPSVRQQVESPEGIAYNTTVNKSVVVQPGVTIGLSQYNTSGTPTEVPADEILRQISLSMVNSARPDLSTPYMYQRWNFLKQAFLKDEAGNVLRQWRDIEDGKVSMFAEMGARSADDRSGAPQYPFAYYSYNQIDEAGLDEGALYAYLIGWFDDEVALREPQFKRMTYDLAFLGAQTNTDVVITTATHKIARISVA